MNYPGLPAVTGPEMRDAFLCQIDGLGIGIREERVNSIYDMGGCYTAVVNGKMYDGRTVILAAGVSGSREIPGESRLLGKGVSYCATCDGELYRGKRIAVICTDPSLEEEIEFLADLAAEVFLCTSYKDRGVRRDNVRHTVGYPSEILGENRASRLVCGGETVEAELRRLANPYIRWEDGTTVSPGDQVACRLASDYPRFQREKVRFVAGSGIFRKELEDMSIGMEAGETRELRWTRA